MLAPGQFEGTHRVFGDRGQELFGEVHQQLVVGVGPVELEHRELGVVPGGDALVPEVAVELEDPFEAADDESFEVQLGSDSQVEIEVEGVVVGLEGPRRCAPRDGLHHRRLDFHEARRPEMPADRRHDLRPHLEDLPHLRVGEQIQVTLTSPRLAVGEAVVLLGQGSECLGEDGQILHRHAELSRAGAEHPPLHAEKVTQIEKLEGLPRGVVEVVLAQVELHLAGAVAEIGKRDLAMPANRPHPSGEPYLRLFGLELLGGLPFEPLASVAHRLFNTEASRKWFQPEVDHGVQLRPAVGQKLFEWLLTFVVLLHASSSRSERRVILTWPIAGRDWQGVCFSVI